MTDTTPDNGPTRDIPAPGWKVLTTDPSSDGTRTLHHVKLGQTHIARQFADEKGNRVPSTFVEVDYVHVSAVRKNVEGREFQETCVTASDEAGNNYGAYLYVAQRFLSLEETMFAVGEI